MFIIMRLSNNGKKLPTSCLSNTTPPKLQELLTENSEDLCNELTASYVKQVINKRKPEFKKSKIIKKPQAARETKPLRFVHLSLISRKQGVQRN